MNSLALRGTLRHWMTKLHRWSGLAMLFFLFVAGVTGAILAFRWEIDRALNPELFTVVPQQRALAQKDLVARIEQARPDTLVSTVILPTTKTDVAVVYLKSRMEAQVAHVHVVGMKATLDLNQLLVDPYTGRILAERSTSKLILSRANFIPDMVRLHYTLFLDEFGAWLMGVAALVWLLSTLVGVWLAWPAAWRSLRGWRPVLSVRWRRGAYKLNYDLHRSTSLVTLPILLAVAFTSVYLNLPVMIKPLVKAVSPATGAFVVPKVKAMQPDDPMATAEQAMQAALARYPDGSVQSIGRDFGKGVYSVRVRRPGDISTTSGNTTVYASMADARVVAVRSLESAAGGDLFLAWMFPLHSGLAFGVTGQWLIFVGAIVLALSCVTGLTIWLRKRRGARSAHARSVPAARAA